MGLKTGFCGGRGGSMHLRFAEAGCLGSNAIVGGNPPHAVGYAFADKYRGRDNVSVTFFGDGATQMGTTLELINLAALYDCPTIFFVENNYYAVSTHVREQTRETRLSSRGPCFGVPALEVDGMDPFAVRKATQWAVDYIRQQPRAGADRGRLLPAFPSAGADPRQRLRLPRQGRGAGLAQARSA